MLNPKNQGAEAQSEKAQEASIQEIRDAFDRSQQLKALSDEHRHELSQVARWRKFSEGEQLVAQDEVLQSFFLLVSGRVKMARAMPNGRKVLLTLFGPGQLFCTVDALGGEPCQNAIIALTDGVCLSIDRQDLFACMEKHNDLAVRLLVALVPHFSECKHCIVEMASMRVEARLARLLTRLGASVGQERPEGLFIPVVLHRQDLADMTGTTIETCIRVMSRWRKESFVETLDTGFLVADLERLYALSDA